eukprot:TRINITY_DN12460_c2_g1_i1.p1 TRINITY_DN12460_c2_g1~~TRINITY_DN12460_c2_g1_i1.p1  ORF type:complete len:355 (+),score=110.43 TRINITY_DN12460_c2_g1_i1:172-1236(+)
MLGQRSLRVLRTAVRRGVTPRTAPHTGARLSRAPPLQQQLRRLQTEAAAAAEAPPTETFDLQLYADAFEETVRSHRDLSVPVLLVVSVLGSSYFAWMTYDILTTQDDKGNSTMDLLIFHKRDQILHDKSADKVKCPTLLIDLNDCLITTTYREGNMSFQSLKRPGLDVFLNELKDQYEIVLFSLSDLQYVQDVWPKIDPRRHYFSNVITRELIKRIDCGEWPMGFVPSFLAPRHKKNLRDVGRRLERVVHVDVDPRNFYDDESQDHNRIVIPKYTGSADDRELLYLIPFLNYLADPTSPFDVRRPIKFYQQKMVEYGVDNIGLAYLLHQEKKKELAPVATRSGGISDVLKYVLG